MDNRRALMGRRPRVAVRTRAPGAGRWVDLHRGWQNPKRSRMAKEHERGEEQKGELLPPFVYPPNLEVNKQLNHSWKTYIQNPNLLLSISRLRVPALFVYGDRDIRPSWPIKQVAQLIAHARFELIEGAEHVMWFSHREELRRLLREFVDDFSA